MTTEERLEKLERELLTTRRRNRLLWIGVALAVGCSFVCLWVARSSTAKPVDSKQRVVMLWDGAGKVSASLTTFSVPGPTPALFDEIGNPRTMLAVFKDGPRLSLAGETGETGVSLAVLKSGPTLTLRDEHGKPRAMLYVDKDGPVLALYDETGKVIWRAP